MTEKDSELAPRQQDPEIDDQDVENELASLPPPDEVKEPNADPPLTPFEQAAAKVRTFPQSPGVYLMKNQAGVVIYVGKATNLRSRAGSYFLKAAAEEHPYRQLDRRDRGYRFHRV